MVMQSDDGVVVDCKAPTRMKREIDWMLMSPLIFAPILPGIKIAFPKNKPLFFGAVGIAFIHR